MVAKGGWVAVVLPAPVGGKSNNECMNTEPGIELERQSTVQEDSSVNKGVYRGLSALSAGSRWGRKARTEGGPGDRGQRGWSRVLKLERRLVDHRTAVYSPTTNQACENRGAAADRRVGRKNCCVASFFARQSFIKFSNLETRLCANRFHHFHILGNVS